MKKRRTTIGFFVSILDYEYQREIWRGLCDEAVKQDINLLCFPGEIASSAVLLRVISSGTLERSGGVIVEFIELHWYQTVHPSWQRTSLFASLLMYRSATVVD